MVKRKAPIKEVRKPTKEYYKANVGCWNCDLLYEINVVRGEITPYYIANNKLVCKGCGCDSLKVLNEYKIEKKILKDVILHHRIEHMHEEPKAPNRDHQHIG